MKTLMPSRAALRDVRIFQSVYGYTSGWRTLHRRYLTDGVLPTIAPRWSRPIAPATPNAVRVPARSEMTVRTLAATIGVKVFKVIAAGGPIGLHLQPDSPVSPGVASWLRERLAGGASSSGRGHKGC